MIDADHGQFYLQDFPAYDDWMATHAMDPNLPPAGWTHEAVHIHRIGVEAHSISVGTARDDLVESLINVHASAPVLEPSAEHVVEADLDVPNGELTVYSPGVDPAEGPTLTVPAVLLRARVSYVPSEPPDIVTNGGPGDHFLYRIDLWPTGQAREVAILRQGPDPWAG
ncbi:hypothetical protein EV644_15022 [Kribbella orskensis]|uniref:Uncharacterized protein n=1 Tax=Kribbella orskensis TaxID=2512216 RepID=A0ABY2B5X4_9ACTN|nr:MULTISPECIES: hypothetical protein [Kribbella]TCN37853.1 hypothetical protein EV642_1102 [Kribbella sp. VKM Ac-2500]TCO08077.1 hypothetical protein EV644_15022 [Kribbella orskensis]